MSTVGVAMEPARFSHVAILAAVAGCAEGQSGISCRSCSPISGLQTALYNPTSVYVSAVFTWFASIADRVYTRGHSHN